MRSSCGIGGGPGGSGGLIIGGGPGGGPKGGLGNSGTMTPGGTGCPAIPGADSGGRISAGGGGGGKREMPGGSTSGCKFGPMAAPGTGGCCLNGGGGGAIFSISLASK